MNVRLPGALREWLASYAKRTDQYEGDVIAGLLRDHRARLERKDSLIAFEEVFAWHSGSRKRRSTV